MSEPAAEYGDAPAAAPPGRRGWARLLWLLVPLGLCLALAGAGRALRWFWDAEREAILADLAGEELAADPAAIRPPPAEGNGAEALAALFDALDGLPPAVQGMLGSSPLQLRAALTDPGSDTAAMVFTPDPNDPACPADAAGAARTIAERLDPIDAALDRALARPCVFPFAWEQGLEATMPHYMEVRELCQGLEVRAGWRALEGRHEAAWDDVERMLRLAPTVDDPCIIGRVIRHVLVKEACATAVELLALGPPPGPERRTRLDEALRSLEETEGFTRALRGELAMAEATLGGDPVRFFEMGGVSRPPLPRFALAVVMARWRLDYVRRLAAVVRASACMDLLDLRAELQRQEAAAQEGDLLARLLIPALVRCHDKELDALAGVRLTRAALRLVAKGALPEQADGLPADPWQPQQGPLRYARRGARSAALWSVGHDRVDGGGRAPADGEDLDTPGVDLVVELALPE